MLQSIFVQTRELAQLNTSYYPSHPEKLFSDNIQIEFYEEKGPYETMLIVDIVVVNVEITLTVPVISGEVDLTLVTLNL